MNALRINSTPNSLDIALDAKNGKFSFSGKSYPENSAVFFAPVITWLEQYKTKPAKTTSCEFKLEYFNSASRKCFMEIFRILEEINKGGSRVSINWHYEDADEAMREVGEEYEDLFNLEFQYNTM